MPRDTEAQSTMVFGPGSENPRSPESQVLNELGIRGRHRVGGLGK